VLQAVGGGRVALERQVVAAVLVFERVQVAAADLHADGRAAGDFGEDLQFVGALGGVFGVVAEEVEEVFVAGAGEVVNAVALVVLAASLGQAVSRGGEFGGEVGTECPLGGCGGYDEMFRAVWTGNDMVCGRRCAAC